MRISKVRRNLNNQKKSYKVKNRVSEKATKLARRAGSQTARVKMGKREKRSEGQMAA